MYWVYLLCGVCAGAVCHIMCCMCCMYGCVPFCISLSWCLSREINFWFSPSRVIFTDSFCFFTFGRCLARITIESRARSWTRGPKIVSSRTSTTSRMLRSRGPRLPLLTPTGKRHVRVRSVTFTVFVHCCFSMGSRAYQWMESCPPFVLSSFSFLFFLCQPQPITKVHEVTV